MNPQAFNTEPGRIEGRVILITGATSGIGRCLALGLAQLGATVLLLGRDIPSLEALYDDIKAQDYPEPGIVPFDLSHNDPERLAALKQVISERYGALHGLIHNAAILGDRVPFEHYKMTTWAEVPHEFRGPGCNDANSAAPAAAITAQRTDLYKLECWLRTQSLLGRLCRLKIRARRPCNPAQ